MFYQKPQEEVTQTTLSLSRASAADQPVFGKSLSLLKQKPKDPFHSTGSSDIGHIEKKAGSNATWSGNYETHFQVTKTKIMFSNHNLPESQSKPDNEKFVYANVLWDSECSDNLITKDLAKELGYSGPSRSTIFEGVAGPTAPTSTLEVIFDIMDNVDL